MPTATYTLIEIHAARDGSGAFSSVQWRGEFFDASGVSHWSTENYAFTTSSEWTPTAAAILANAKTEADVVSAVRVDADRVLADLLDPNTPAGRPAFMPIALEN